MAEEDTQDPTRFDDLFAHPSIEAMHALEPEEFEHFVGHVFGCAGYTVKHVARRKYPHGTGVDLDLRGATQKVSQSRASKFDALIQPTRWSSKMSRPLSAS